METNDDKPTEKYACDCCRSRKVACSRDSNGCNQCTNLGTKCTYSRSGVIHRKRKRTGRDHTSSQAIPETSANSTSSTTTVERSADAVQCHLAPDIEVTRERLSKNTTPQRQGLIDALSSLSEACTNTGLRHEAPKLQPVPQDSDPFEEHATEWTETFEGFLRKSELLRDIVPPEVMRHLKAGRPSQVHQRVWLVMYYSVIIGNVTSLTEPVKEKLQSHLRTALSDVGILLEPSEANIFAITLALSQASGFMGPSVCWMLGTSACRMLQALGVTQQSLDPQTRERRQRLFWHLNLLDKGFAIIFGRTPTFNRAMQRQIGLPKLGRLQYIRSHENSSGTSMVFGAHFMHQKILLSYLMGDIWYCLYEEEKRNDDRIKSLYKDLVSWYDEAKRLLDAAAVSEKPFCDTKNAKSIDIALCAMEFHFIYLSILLSRTSPDMELECLQNSKKMLNLLPKMSVKSKEPYHPIIWQLVCCPLTPLLILLCDTVSNPTRSREDKKENLAAMELFPGYLKDLGQRDSLARRLEGITRVFVRHARSAIDCQSTASSSIPSPEIQRSTAFSEDPPWSLYDETLCASVFGSGDGSIPSIFPMRSSDYDTDIVNDLTTLQNSFDVCGDRLFDWLTWDTGN